VTGHVPAGVETHAAFRVGKDFYPFGIKRVEASVRQDTPMGRLKIMEPLDLLFAVEIAGGFWKGLKSLKEIPQTGLEMALQLRTATAQEIAQFAVEAGKRQSLAQAACLVPSRLIRWRFLHQNHPQIRQYQSKGLAACGSCRPGARDESEMLADTDQYPADMGNAATAGFPGFS
jgi:hypothetical protein